MRILSIVKSVLPRPVHRQLKRLRWDLLTPVELRKLPAYYYTGHHKKIRIDTEIDVFSTIARQVIEERQTLLKEDRLYTLFQLAQQLRVGDSIVEVGVYKGGSTKFLCEVLLGHEVKTDIYAIDTFEGFNEVDSRLDGKHNTSTSFKDTSFEQVAEYLKSYENLHLIKGDIKSVSDQVSSVTQIGLLHCDVDTYGATKYVLDNFHSQITVNGSIVCDDYGFTSCKGAKLAVDQFVSEHNNWRMLHLLTGQAILHRNAA